jgi:phosphatidylethanolamine-binding protein (PEBP) family uncharacterized protein
MQLSSSAFSDGSAIPRRFTCDGEDLSPPLEWGGAPTEPQSFVLLCDDPDAPAGTWHHWAAYDSQPLKRRWRGGAKHAKGRVSTRQSTTSSSQLFYQKAFLGKVTVSHGCSGMKTCTPFETTVLELKTL